MWTFPQKKNSISHDSVPNTMYYDGFVENAEFWEREREREREREMEMERVLNFFLFFKLKKTRIVDLMKGVFFFIFAKTKKSIFDAR